MVRRDGCPQISLRAPLVGGACRPPSALWGHGVSPTPAVSPPLTWPAVPPAPWTPPSLSIVSAVYSFYTHTLAQSHRTTHTDTDTNTHAPHRQTHTLAHTHSPPPIYSTLHYKRYCVRLYLLTSMGVHCICTIMFFHMCCVTTLSFSLSLSAATSGPYLPHQTSNPSTPSRTYLKPIPRKRQKATRTKSLETTAADVEVASIIRKACEPVTHTHITCVHV